MTPYLERLYRLLLIAIKRNDRVSIINLQIRIRRAGA